MMVIHWCSIYSERLDCTLYSWEWLTTYLLWQPQSVSEAHQRRPATTTLQQHQHQSSDCSQQATNTAVRQHTTHDMQICIWPSWCHCHSLSLASVKSRLVLPFWYWLTRVVLDRGPLNVCVSVCVYGSVHAMHTCPVSSTTMSSCPFTAVNPWYDMLRAARCVQMKTSLLIVTKPMYLMSGWSQQFVCPYIVSGRKVAATRYTARPFSDLPDYDHSAKLTSHKNDGGLLHNFTANTEGILLGSG